MYDSVILYLPQSLLETLATQKAALGHPILEEGLPGRVWDTVQTGSAPIPFLMFTKFNKATNLEQVACVPTAAHNYLRYNCLLFHSNLGGLHLVSNRMQWEQNTIWEVTY